MGKLDTVKTVVEIAKSLHDALIAHKDERARRREELRKAEDEKKDREIEDLKRQLKKETP